MAAFDFPNSPSNGQTYSANGIDWIYNGSLEYPQGRNAICSGDGDFRKPNLD